MHRKIFGLEPVILVVDDQTTDIRMLSEAVRDLGNVQLATDGRSAILAARRWGPDVVLLDIEMPGMNGFEVCRALKSDPKTCDAAVIFVTSHTQTENELRALDYGGIDFLQKPLNIPLARARIKAHIALRNEAKKLANHDALTGLPNRFLLQDRIEQALQNAQSSQGQVAMLLIHLDNLKAISDSFGQSVSDELLREVSSRLTACSQAVDTVSRQRGEEFIILLPDVSGVDAIGALTVRLLSAVSAPFSIQANRYDLSASIGISVFPDDSHSLDSLYQHADSAMCRARQEGRNRYRFFSSDIESSIRAKQLLEQGMRNTLEHGLFDVFYQAKIDARDNRVMGVEALIRWRDGDGNFIPPMDFIPLAEETGLIVPIGQFVLLKACMDAKKFYEHGQAIPVSVNISAVQLQEESFLGMVMNILADSGLSPELLELEITEGVHASPLYNTRETLIALRALGVRISIDDFGTGYSNLTYLKRFPIDVLKIDQSFVKDLLVDKSDAAIIVAIIAFAEALGLELVAEGVETCEQAATLRSLGCNIMQGFLYSRPIPFAHMCTFLAEAATNDVTP
ncbi:EAL domain-containing protein [Pseudomonas sp. UMAB-08]|uniref:two-component system response regulator n=1 Tax=Pseudomonas sp. UMAB-08 TaxID=1365375 RepID=UPI001C563961|nr:EAL domain-containing protein [Pseudomonas sp. UMAB-08]